ncbi:MULTISPECIES: phosphoribosyltransferase [unclassified Streptomyces]|uniref:phosphoribosyltransferase n=1 Tax=unclassified Streptomyces TaxID=2593676 RepID=UPI00073C08CC|nr:MULTISPECIES: phosphoribosyltransferase family protein [unclassified Streptomyces]ODA72681.1 Xanthine phosphoribosyltransferase [Streptomyces sp. AVP053U2]
MNSPEAVGDTAVAGEQPGMWTRQGPYELSWDDLKEVLDRIVEAVRADGFTPGAVLGVARGGLLAASYLTCALDVPVMHTVRVRRTRDDSQYAAKRPPLLEQEGPAPVFTGPVLVVDDIVGTGATWDVVRSHLSAAGVAAADVRFASLVRNHRCGHVPDYCPAVVDDWVVFPWEQGWGRTPGVRPFPLGEAG